jgi:hypothetical protein
MAEQIIKFLKGVNRLRNAPLDAPRNLRNCRINRFGELVSMRQGLIGGGTYPNGNKPWIPVEYSDGSVDWLTASDNVDDYVKHAGRTYVTGRDSHVFRRYDADGVTTEEEPPIIFAASAGFWMKYADGTHTGEDYAFDHVWKEFTPEDHDIRGVTMGTVVDYRLIPYNRYGEAGPAYDVSFLAVHDSYTEGFDPTNVDAAIPQIDMYISTNVAYVEVYRTVERLIENWDFGIQQILNQFEDSPIGEGFKDIRKEVLEKVSRQLDQLSDAQNVGAFFYESRFESRHNAEPTFGDGVLMAITPSAYWPNPILGRPGFENIGPILDKNISTWGYELTGFSVPTGDVDRDENIFTGPKIIKPMTSKVAFKHADRALWGNVNLPTKQAIPNVMLNDLGVVQDRFGDTFDSSTPPDIILQYEYETKDGPVHGLPYYEDGVYVASAPYRGESALLVWVHDGTDYRLWERIKPDSNLRYITKYQKDWGADGTTDDTKTFQPSVLESFVSLAFEDTDLIALNALYSESIYGPYEPTDYILQEELILMSEQFRPMEHTYLGAPTPDSRPVRAIVGARLAEEESIRAYDFYVMTDRNVYVCRREEDTLFFDTVMAGVGVAYNDDDLPMAVEVLDGAAMVGTDGRVYYLSGRGFQRLDMEIPDLFTDVQDIAFDPKNNELVIHNYATVFTDDAFWIYNFDDQGWIAERDASQNSERVTDIDYSDVHGVLLLRLNDGTVLEWNEDDTTAALDTSVELQPLRGTGNVDIRGIKVDYDPHELSGTYQATEGTNVITRNSGDTLLSTHVQGIIRVVGAGTDAYGSSCDLISHIASISGNDITLTDTIRPDDPLNPTLIASSFFWGPPIRIIMTTSPNLYRLFTKPFYVSPNRLRYPKVRGRNVVIEIRGFNVLREILILFDGDLQTD